MDEAGQWEDPVDMVGRCLFSRMNGDDDTHAVLAVCWLAI